MLCHNPWVEKKTTVFGVQSASPLGVNTPQLNRQCDSRRSAANQLATWHEIGLLGLDARPRQAAEARRSLRRVGRSRSPGAVVPANELRPLPPVQRGRHGQHRAGLRRAARANQDGRRPADPGDVQHRRGQDHRARRSGRLGALLPDVQARRRPHAAGRLQRRSTSSDPA